jgi:hypothetical protein
MNPGMNDDDLPALRATDVPRRTDAAFARAVAAGVDARRHGKKGWSALVPLLAPVGVGLGILAFVVLRSPERPAVVLAPLLPPEKLVAVAGLPSPTDVSTDAPADDDTDDDTDDSADDSDVADEDVADELGQGAGLLGAIDDLDDDGLVAFAGPSGAAADHEPLFAFDGLDGSDDRELDDVEHALDAALARKL